jgi:hypothetical protein
MGVMNSCAYFMAVLELLYCIMHAVLLMNLIPIVGCAVCFLGMTSRTINASDLHARPEHDATNDPIVRISWGAGQDESWVGYGWGKPDRYGPERIRWMVELEGDINLPHPVPVQRMFLRIDAIPAYVDWRRQRVGVFVNERYVGEARFRDEPVFHTFTFEVPSRYWRKDNNVITLRAAYKFRIGQDSRKLALGLKSLSLYLAPPDGHTP